MDAMTEISSPTVNRLEHQIQWYDQKSQYCQRLFKALKAVTIISGVLGAVIVVVEGLQQLNQYQAN